MALPLLAALKFRIFPDIIISLERHFQHKTSICTYNIFYIFFQLFLALVLSSFNIAIVLFSTMYGRIVDKLGHTRIIFLFTCGLEVVACIVYSVNISGYFPLFGRLLSGIACAGRFTIFLGQIALQCAVKDRTAIYMLLEGAYCLGATIGPALGSLVTFNATIWGWHINQGNSPGIVLTLIWTVFTIVTIILPHDMWVEAGTGQKEILMVAREDDVSGDGEKMGEHVARDQVFGYAHQKDNRFLEENYLTSDLDDDEVESSVSQNVTCNKDKVKIEWSPQILCLLYLTFMNEIFSSTATFYTPILALNHLHLKLIHVELLFLNCSVFTFLVFILFSLASVHFDERKLFLAALGMQITALSVLTSIGFAWNHIANAQNYMLLLYICLGMPYFAYPFCNSILSKITDPRNASFYQALSFTALNFAIFSSRVVMGFVSTKETLIMYCFILMFFWLVGSIWFSIHYKQFFASEKLHSSE